MRRELKFIHRLIQMQNSKSDDNSVPESVSHTKRRHLTLNGLLDKVNLQLGIVYPLRPRSYLMSTDVSV
jgi:hypothetical protein